MLTNPTRSRPGRRLHPAHGARIATGLASVLGVAGLAAYMAAGHNGTTAAATISTAAATPASGSTSASATTSTTVASRASSSSAAPAATAATPSASANTSSHGS